MNPTGSLLTQRSIRREPDPIVRPASVIRLTPEARLNVAGGPLSLGERAGVWASFSKTKLQKPAPHRLQNRVELLTSGHFFNPEGIAALSPGLRGTSYPGNARHKKPTLKGLKHPYHDPMALEIPERAPTPSGLRRIAFVPTQGSSPTRNPGLSAGIPLGFKQADERCG